MPFGSKQRRSANSRAPCARREGTIKVRIAPGSSSSTRSAVWSRRIRPSRASSCRTEGKIFLNPEPERIIEHAYRTSIGLTAWNRANMKHARGNVLEALVRYRFRGITCSIDGVTGDVCRLPAEGRRRAGARQHPLLERLQATLANAISAPRWQFVWFERNAHEGEAARALAASLGMRFHVKQNWAAAPLAACADPASA
jgi:hypothetical protein